MFDELGFFDVVKGFVDFLNGFVFVGGLMGLGKSIMFVVLIDYINCYYGCYIVMIEDLIEVVYVQCESLINQWEVGMHVFMFVVVLWVILW